MQNLVENYKKFGKKIWLTEFACADQNYDVYLGVFIFLARKREKGGDGFCTSKQIRRRIKRVVFGFFLGGGGAMFYAFYHG